MIEPSPSQMKALSNKERKIYQFSNWCNQKLKVPFIYWNACFMYSLIWIGLSRRLFVIGLENVKDINPESRVLIAANHRTFFDFFVTTWVNFDRTNLPRKIYFPVRSRFFYDNLMGVALNFCMGGCAMFPPIFREQDKKEFNRYSIDRIAHELNRAGVTIGFHPEGRRNKDPDPYGFLPAKSGIGEVIIKAPVCSVLPVFLYGLCNQYFVEVYRNIVCPSKHPIYVCYGKPLQFSEKDTDALKISEKVMSEIVSLSEQQRKQMEAEHLVE
jgi:1-acyl-sn-glycerol-3-phosphate acyltransferase